MRQKSLSAKIKNILTNKGETNMLYLLQIYKMVTDKNLFINLFSDLDYELDELGYKDAPEELINEMLSNHFGITIDDERQLKILTNTIINKKDLNFLKALP
jgi:hypothetical protein